MASKVSRGEALLNRWANDPKITLTREGKDWLVAVMDPFHDTPLKHLAGWPDVESGMSVVRCIQRQATIKKPEGHTGNWDAHVALVPVLDRHLQWNSSQRVNNHCRWIGALPDPSPPSTFHGVAGVTCAAVSAGETVNWFPQTDTSHPGGPWIYLTLPDAYTKGVGRLVGVGFEVHDTTAKLNKQGSCTVYRQMESGRDPTVFNGCTDKPVVDEIQMYTFSGTPLRAPPQSLDDAILLPGSRTWAAEDGCYQVGTFHTTENPAFCVDYGQPVWFDCGNDDSMNPIGGNGNQFYTPAAEWTQYANAGEVKFFAGIAPSARIHPIHQSGAIFAGLHDSAALTVNVKYYYETFPSVAESEILVLATPSGEFDPMALNIYSHAMSNMPVGVKVGDNNSGDWFWDVVQKVAKVAGPILGAIPHPIAQGLAPVVTTIGNNLSEGKKKKKKTKKNNAALSAGNRGKKGKIQGPMRGP